MMKAPPNNNYAPDVRVQTMPPPAAQAVDPNPAHRRATPRCNVELEVNLETDSNFYMGLTENISEGGLFVATHRYKPLGTLVTLSFRVPNRAEPITIKGEVRWLRPANGRNEVHPGMGIQFVDVGPDELAAIRAFIRKREPLFYED
jgi:uncharacterized protein (TIGR02266 family)